MAGGSDGREGSHWWPRVQGCLRATAPHTTRQEPSLRHTQVSRGYECPQGGGRHVRQADDRGGALSCPSRPAEPVGQWRAAEGAGEGAPGAGQGVFSPQEAGGSGPSGLRDLLAARGAGREPGGGALLGAEAVLVLFLYLRQRLDGDSQQVKGLHTFWNTRKLL